MSARRRTREAVQRRADEAAEAAINAATVKTERPLPDFIANPATANLPRKPPGWKREGQS